MLTLLTNLREIFSIYFPLRLNEISIIDENKNEILVLQDEIDKFNIPYEVFDKEDLFLAN